MPAAATALVKVGVEEYLRLIRRERFRAEEIDHLLCHYSSHFLKGEIQKLTAAQQELQSLKALHERLAIIATEFPDLLDFERDGLLPGADRDGRRQEAA